MMMMCAFRGQKYVVGSWLCGGCPKRIQKYRIPKYSYLRKHKLKKEPSSSSSSNSSGDQSCSFYFYFSIFLFFLFLFIFPS